MDAIVAVTAVEPAPMVVIPADEHEPVFLGDGFSIKVAGG